MKYPLLHSARRARRNAPTTTIATKGDFVRMRIGQLRQFQKHRGSFKTTKLTPARPPYKGGALRYQVIPRTTNSDVKALVKAWDRAFKTYGIRDRRWGGSHNKDFEVTHRRRWRHTKKLVRQRTRDKPARAEFSHNAEFWAIWLNDLARYLSVRQQGRPSRLEVIIDVIAESASERVQAVASAAHKVTNAIVTPIGGTFGPWLKWGALAGAGLLIIPPIIRATRARN